MVRRTYAVMDNRGCSTVIARTIGEAIRRSFAKKWNVLAVFDLSLVAIPFRGDPNPVSVLAGQTLYRGGAKR
jgi:hypothetical protein